MMTKAERRAKALELAINARAIVGVGEVVINHDTLFAAANNFLRYIEDRPSR